MGGDLYTIMMPDIKYNDMLLLVRFIYGGEVTVPLKQLGDLQDLIQLLQLDPGHVNGKFVIENIQDKSILPGTSISATITVVSPPSTSIPNSALPNSPRNTVSENIGSLPIHVSDRALYFSYL